MPVDPGEARVVEIPAGTLVSAREPAGIRDSYAGQPGALIGGFFGISLTTGKLAPAVLRSPHPTEHGGGNNPWDLSNGRSSVQYIKNIGDEDAFYVARIMFPGGSYKTERRKVAPGQTVAIDLGHLRHDQVPDAYGRTLPRDVSSGQLDWRWRGGSGLIGQMATASPSLGYISPMIARPCCCLPFVELDPPFDAWITLSPHSPQKVVGDRFTFGVWEDFCDCNTCPNADPPLPASWLRWQSSASSIASVDYYSGEVSCNAPGTSTITGTYDLFLGEDIYLEYGECFCQEYLASRSSAETVTVQRPTSLAVVSVTTLPTGNESDRNVGCFFGQDYGIMIDIKYQTLDQNGQPIRNGTMVPHEHVTYGSGPLNGGILDTDICPSTADSCTHFTAADGTWHDAPLGVCGNFNFGSQYFTQSITMISNGVPYSVRVNSFVATAGSTSGHGSITNQSDIIKTR